jgi:hypothetical protein
MSKVQGLPKENTIRQLADGDFVLSRRSAPLSAYEPHARNFVLCLDIYPTIFTAV